MINLEFYKDEIIDKYINRDERKYFDCILCEVRNKIFDCQKPCYQCLEESFDWLLEEHKEPIELTQLEYDLLNRLVKANIEFKQHELFLELSTKGHFKGIKDTSMKIEEILDNCEVVE